MIKNDRKDRRGQNRFAQHHQFEGLDESVASRDLGEIGVGACPKGRHDLARLIMIGQYGDTPGGVLLLEELDAPSDRVRIIAGIDNEQDGLISGYRTQDSIVDARRGSDDTKIRRLEDTDKTFSKQGARPDKNRRRWTRHE